MTAPSSGPIVVAGGAGFLGSHLCEKLIASGHSVLCLDNLVTGDSRNVDALRDMPGFGFRHWDIAEPFNLFEASGIFNLACPASPSHYQADPVRTTMTSVRGTYNLLELAKSTSAPLLQASTSEVYGDPAVHPQTEAYWGHVNPTGLRACYDEGKRCAESLCFDYQRTHSLTVKVARIFNTYGPRMQIEDGRVVSNFIVQALRNEPITIYGDGLHTRSFCYVDDLIDGLVRFMAHPHPLATPVNLGNPEEFTIRELAAIVVELTGSRSRMIHLPLPSDDPVQRCPNITLARNELRWTPRVSLRQGLERTILYFDRMLTGSRPPKARVRAAVQPVRSALAVPVSEEPARKAIDARP